MDFRKEKIRIAIENLEKLMTTEKISIDFEYVNCDEYKVTNNPPEKNADWKSGDENLLFSGIDKHAWLHMTFKTPCLEDGKEARFAVKTGREETCTATNPQFTVYLNGKTAQALDSNHTWIPLASDTEYDIYVYLYTGMVEGKFNFLPSIDIMDLRIEDLYYDIQVPYMCMELLDKDSHDYVKIRDSLDKALLRLDLRHVYSEDFYASLKDTSEYMKNEFYGKICHDTEMTVSCIGHTHIDVAWLWTVAQTREKAQRSFSTVLNMMRRYDDYIFMSSQPQLYQYIKESDPEMYEQIKERIKEGRWEAEGGMWLEADTNLISGESLIRQIIYGKRFMKEEFGVDNKILWLPDVFGYSAALAQILQKSGITQFFTTKMAWNETNEMPNDSFIWEGIDGSQIFTAFRKDYVKLLDPQAIYDTWKEYKNKSLTSSAILTFGYGDGGGGPTYDMMENYKRLKYGIPGIPQAKIEKAGEFFDRCEKEFEQNSKELANTPKWVGEMYLEMHRGTYTSIAKNKKNNRKSELLYLEAESLSVADMILNDNEYPEDIFRKNQTNILLNQFHDIIPGSSIKEVYDVTDIEYERILREGNEIKSAKLESIKNSLNTEGGIFVYNPTPFEMSDYLDIDGKTVYAENIPAHGWKVIADTQAKNKVTVSDNSIENDVIRIVFNDKYHIISVYDKEENREVLSDGAEANRIEIFEDYPREYDAWEITDYYKQKMWIADDVTEVSLIKNGLRIKRKYQKSEIIQDITLRNGSKRIDFATTVDWHEDHVLMKASFPVDIRNTYATYDIQFGNLQRPTHANTSWDAAKFEVCAHKWADLSETGYGVSILNDCKYGYSIEDNIMKISLLKSATYPNPCADRGMHSFTYSLYPHKGDFIQGKTVMEGYLLNMPLECSVVSASDGIISGCQSIASSDAENLVIETIKKAEDGNSVIVRAYETYNQKSNAVITVGFDFKKVYLCDLLENNIKELEHDGRNVKVNAGNFEIITLKFEV